jgi:hypothetical protein
MRIFFALSWHLHFVHVSNLCTSKLLRRGCCWGQQVPCEVKARPSWSQSLFTTWGQAVQSALLQFTQAVPSAIVVLSQVVLSAWAEPPHRTMSLSGHGAGPAVLSLDKLLGLSEEQESSISSLSLTSSPSMMVEGMWMASVPYKESV